MDLTPGSNGVPLRQIACLPIYALRRLSLDPATIPTAPLTCSGAQGGQRQSRGCGHRSSGQERALGHCAGSRSWCRIVKSRGACGVPAGICLVLDNGVGDMTMERD